MILKTMRTYSNVVIDELNIKTNNEIICASFTKSLSHVSELIVPILNNVYETQGEENLHVYLEDGEGHVKYLFIEFLYDYGSILIIYNNLTDPLLKSQQYISSNQDYGGSDNYYFVKDINGNYFWNSKIYNLIECRADPSDFNRDILYELIVPEDKQTYLDLIDNDSFNDAVIRIKTNSNVTKTLNVNSSYLHTNDSISQTVVYITNISNRIDERDKNLANDLLKKLDAKIGAGYLVRTTNGEVKISRAFHNILHLSSREIGNLGYDFKNYLVDEEDKILFDDFTLGKVSNFEKVIKYKSPNYDKVQYLFVYFEHYVDDESDLVFVGVIDVSDEHERELYLTEKNDENQLFIDLISEMGNHLGVSSSVVDRQDKKYYGIEHTARIAHIDMETPE